MSHRSAWRRIGALALVVVLTASAPVVAEAAPAASHHSVLSTRSLAPQLAHAPIQATRLSHVLTGRLLRPLTSSAAPAQAVTDPTKLAITPPSNAIQPQAATVNTTFANDSNQNIFIALNNGAYDTAGMQSGYAQSFSLPIGTGSDTVDVFYLASIYGSADQANARVAATQQYLASKQLTGQSCGTSCYLYALEFADSTGRTISLTYVVWSSDNVVAEIGFFVPQDVQTANSDAFLSTIQNVVGLVTTVVPVQQAASTLAVADFELFHTVKGKAKLTKKLKSGEAGIFAADLQLPNANDTIQAQVTFTIGKKTVGPLLLGNPQTASDGSVVVAAKHKFKVKKTTTVVAQLQVQDGAAQATGSLKFKVTK